LINLDVALLHLDSREIPKSEGVNSPTKLIFRKIMLNKTLNQHWFLFGNCFEN